MGALQRLPAWATTGVGSLPHDDADRAVAHVAAAYDVPFCPQLPRLEGDMVAEWLGTDPRRCGWSPGRDRERPRAWHTLLAQLDRSFPRHRVVKLQVTGPATLACALERERGGAASRVEALALARELATWLAANAIEQIQVLAARQLDALLVIDEPALHLFGTDGIEAAWDPLRAIAPAWGLHLCGPVPWDVVDRAEPDVLSFDLARGGLSDGGAHVLRRLLARDARIAWGILQAHRPERAPHALKRLRPAAARVLADGEHCLLTATCGTARTSIRRETQIATDLSDSARSMREHGSTSPARRSVHSEPDRVDGDRITSFHD